MKLSFPLAKPFCNQLWSFLAKQKCVLFYELAEPRELIKTFDRADNIDIESMSGSTVCFYYEIDLKKIILIQPTLLPSQLSYTIYKYNPISQDNGALRGSCQDFDTRKEIKCEDVTHMTYDEVLEK